MKVSEIAFEFPVLGISDDNDLWGFSDLRQLTTCGPRTLKENMQLGMELVDAGGRRWRVEGVRRMGRSKPLIPWLIKSALSGPTYRIEQELAPMAPLTLDEVKERLASSMRAHPEFWCDDPESASELRARLEEVAKVRAFTSIHDLLGLDTFEAY